jgi:hypothetical protein
MSADDGTAHLGCQHEEMVTFGGRTVRLVFEFRMNGNPPDKMIWFGCPNRFEIWEVSPRLWAAAR